MNLAWAYSLLHRIKLIRWKTAIAKSKLSVKNFARVKSYFLDSVVAVVKMEEVIPQGWFLTETKLVENLYQF